MTDVQIEVGDLFANIEERTIAGLLVPYGEVGNTNLGKFEIPKGTVSIPLDASIVGLNLDHARENPIGRTATLTDTDQGITATFSVARTPEGDAALADAAAPTGTRKKLSVEMTGIVLRAGKLVSGRIFGAALVAKGAFPSAALLAADVGTLPTDPAAPPAGPTVTVDKTSEEFTDEQGVTRLRETTTTTTIDGDTTTIDTTTIITDPTGDPSMATATAPNTLTAGTSATPRPLSVHEVGVLYAQRAQGRISDAEFSAALDTQNGNTLFAALSDVKYDGVGGLLPALSPAPQWLGQVWSATTYRQQVLPLFGHGDLTSLNFSGFKFTTKPAGGDWLGNKANVPSNVIIVAPVTGAATRYAIGHDIAREFVDFPVEGFFESYAAAVSEDYSRWADGKVATAVLAGATALAGDALAGLPGAAGGTIGSAASAIIDGAAAIITAGSLPDFALVATALWKQMAKMPRANVIGYLNASLGLEEGALDGFTIRPSASVAVGKVLVGCKAAVTVLELPGAPIRVDALDLARGGVDKAAFGYIGINVNDAAGLQLVTAAV